MSDETEEDWLDRILHGDSEPADLREELERSMFQRDGKWMLKHRYLELQEHKPKRNAWYNDRFEANRTEARQHLADKQWWIYVAAHPKDYYSEILEEIKDLAPAADWCHAVRSAWHLSDVLWINRDAWLRIFSDRARIVGVSTKEELDYLNSRKDPLTIYRGCLPEYVDGLSWSLDESAVEHFKRAAGYRGVIFSGKVEKKHILAYMNPNNEEFEIIVSPADVTDKQNLG